MTTSKEGSRSDRTWSGDWESRVLSAVQGDGNKGSAVEGYSNISEFARAYPSYPYAALANRLGGDIAPVHIEQVLRQFLLASGQMTTFALDSAVRMINEYLPNGWGRDESPLCWQRKHLERGAVALARSSMNRPISFGTAWRILRYPMVGYPPIRTIPF